MPLLANHIAVVTGAASGIGSAIAVGFAREGARVVLLDINEEGAREVTRQIRDAGFDAESIRLDVTRREDCFAIASRIAKEIGQVSVLVNDAGINRRNAFTADAEAVLRDWQDIMAINLNGVFNVTHAFLEPLKAASRRPAGGYCRTRDFPGLRPLLLCHRLDRDGRRRIPDDLRST